MQISSGIIKMSLMGKLETMLYVSSLSSNFRLEFTDKTFLFYNIQTNRTLLMFQSIAFWFVFFFFKEKDQFANAILSIFFPDFFKRAELKDCKQMAFMTKQAVCFLRQNPSHNLSNVCLGSLITLFLLLFYRVLAG